MDFPYYEIQLKPRKLGNGKFKARCGIKEHTGDKVRDILASWELEQEGFDTEGAANRVMKFNAVRYLKREYGLTDLDRVKIS